MKAHKFNYKGQHVNPHLQKSSFQLNIRVNESYGGCDKTIHLKLSNFECGHIVEITVSGQATPRAFNTIVNTHPPSRPWRIRYE